MEVPFDAFVAPARARPELWRLVLGLAVLAAVWFTCVLAAGGTMVVLLDEAEMTRLLGNVEAPDSIEGQFALFALFLPLWLGLWAALRYVHGRGLSTVFGPGGLRIGGVLAGGLALLPYVAISGLVMAFLPVEIVRGLPYDTWLAILPFALLMVFFQSAAEEMIFRGYMQQQIAARTGCTLAAMLIPSLLFGLGHYSAGFGENRWEVVVVLGLAGLILADATRRTGNLSLAIGIHFANNLLSTLIVGSEQALGEFALWLDASPPEPWLVRAGLAAQGIAMIAAWGLAVWLSRRRASALQSRAGNNISPP